MKLFEHVSGIVKRYVEKSIKVALQQRIHLQITNIYNL